MKSIQLLITFAMLLVFHPSFAQTAVEGQQEFMKSDPGNALLINIQGESKNVTEVLEQKFESATNEKMKTKKGFHYLEGVVFPMISNNRLDIYFSVDRVSRKAANQSTVILFLSAGNENFLTSDEYPSEMEAAIDMLEGLELEVKIYEMGLLIQDQEDVIGKAERTFDKMVQDSVGLEEDLAELLQEIEQNKINRKNQTQLITDEKERLSEYRLQLEELVRKQDGSPNEDEDLIDDILDETVIREDGDDEQ